MSTPSFLDKIVYDLEREKAIQGAMRAAITGKGPGALMQVLAKHENNPDIGQALKTVKELGYGVCMCAASTGDAELFGRVCELGGNPFEMDEASGETPFSVTLFYMDRKYPGANEHLFKTFLEMRAMDQPTTYYLDDLVGSIWGAGVKTGKSGELLQCAMDAGLDLLSPMPVDPDDRFASEQCPLERLCRRIDDKTINCLEWILESECAPAQDIIGFLEGNNGAVDWGRLKSAEPDKAHRLMGIINKTKARQSQANLEATTCSVGSGKALSGPRF